MDATDDFARNLAHKLVAAGVGCVTASARQQSCDSGALGATVGEMFGDYFVDNPNDLNEVQRQKIIEASKLVAGSVALLANVDVGTAANTAGEVVKNNSTFPELPKGMADMMAYQFSAYKYAEEHGLSLEQARRIIGSDQRSFYKVKDVLEYNDMTILNVSGGVVGQTFIINNKNGKLFAPKLFEVNTSSTVISGGLSLNFGSIKGGVKTANEIDSVIIGSSVGMQGCFYACAGAVRTQGGDTVYTYGIGTPQVGVTAGTMEYTGVTLSRNEINQLLNK